MPTRIQFLLRKRHAMNNRVSCKIIIRVEKKSKQGQGSVCLQSFVNKQRCVIPLSIYLTPKFFNAKDGTIRSTHAEAASFNKIIADARTRTAEITVLANNKHILLTAKSFRAMFEERASSGDFLQYMMNEIVERYKTFDIKRNTFKDHRSTVTLYKEFKKTLEFSEINAAVMEAFRLWMKARKKHLNTIAGHLKNMRTYMNRALEAGYEFDYAFSKMRICRVKNKRVFLIEEDVKNLLKMYQKRELPEHLHTTLMFFLLACFTSLRVSDALRVNSRMLRERSLYFEPIKTNQMNKWVEIPLSEIAQKIVNDVLNFSGKIKTEQRMNDDLKVIGAYAGIKKTLTFHVGRHTFATIFLRLGGKVEVLKEVLGHESINTTMEYVHVVNEDKRNQVLNFDKIFE